MKTLQVLPLLAAATLLAPGGLLAQTTSTWDAGGGDSDLLNATNWSGDAVPASTNAAAAGRADATWDGSVAGALSLTYGAAFGGSFGVGLVMTTNQTSSLNIANSATTNNTFRIVNSTASTNGGIQLASGAGALTIGAAGTNNPITLALGQGSTALNYYFANNSTNTATIEENVTITKGGSHNASLIFGAGTWDVKGTVGNLNAGSLAVNGGTVTVSGNNINTNTFINGGTLKFNAANNLGTGTNAVRLGQTTSDGVLEFIGASDTTVNRQMRVGNGANAADDGNGTINNNGTGVLTFDNATFNQAGAAGTNRSLTLGGTNTGTNTVSGTIVDNTGTNATVKVAKDNDGKWVLSGNNTFTGGVDLKRGILALGHDNALGTGTLNLNNGGSGTAWTIQSSDATARTITNAVTLGTSGTFSGTGNLLFTGAVNGGSGAKTITVTGITTEFSNTLSGNGDRLKVGTGTLVFSGDNSTATNNLYVNQGTLAFTSANALGSSTNAIRVGQQNTSAVLKYTGAGDATVGRQINIGNGAAAGDDGSSTIQNNSATGALTFSNATFNAASAATVARSLTLRGTNTGNNLISGNITDNTGTNAAVSLVKNDAGTWNLTGENTFSGGVQIWNGVLEIDGNGSLGAQTVMTRIGRLSTSGTLRHTGASNTTVTGQVQVGFGGGGTGNGTIESSGLGTLSFNNATFNVAEGGAATNRTLTLGGDNTGDNTISGAIVNNNNASARIALIKAGTGKWILDGANTYSNATTVSNGTLIINGSIASGSAVTVDSGATLGGTGSAGSVTVNGTFAPGAPATNGTFTVTIALSVPGTAQFRVFADNINDKVIASGGATLGGTVEVLVDTNYTPASGDTYNVVDGTISGTPTLSLPALGGGLSWVTNNFLSAGELHITNGGVTPYNAWVAYWQTNSSGFTNTAGTDNPDGDPFDNNEEFAFDGNPTIGTAALLTVVKVGTNTVFNYVALTNTNAVTYNVQATTNLSTGPWTNSAVSVTNSTNQTGLNIPAYYTRKEFVVPASGEGFYRVQATIAP